MGQQMRIQILILGFKGLPSKFTYNVQLYVHFPLLSFFKHKCCSQLSADLPCILRVLS